MILKFSVCPHDTAKGISKWIDFSEKLSKKTGLKVEFKPIPSFQEEPKRLKEEHFHIYYAGPLRQIELFKDGYLPVAKFRGQWDTLFTIAKRDLPKEGVIKVALPFLKPAGYGLIDLDINRTEFLFTKDFYEVYKLVKEGKADIGLMYNEVWDQIPDREDIKILEDTNLQTQHIFMIDGSLYNQLKPVMLTFHDLEEATIDDIKKTERLMERFEILSRRWEMENIAHFFIKSGLAAVIIHRDDKIVFINDYVSDLTSFSKEELLKMSYREFIGRTKDDIGKKINIPFITKDNRIVYLDIYSSKSLYLGGPAEIVLMVDNTNRTRFETLLNLVREVNQAIIHSLTEEELFEKISTALVGKVGLKLVWIGEEDAGKKEVKPIYIKGEAKEYTYNLYIPLEQAKSRGPTATALIEDRIIINQDTLTNESVKPWRERLLQYNLLSSAAIPLKIDGKPEYVLNLYSDQRGFFKDDLIEIMEELRVDLEFGLEKIRQMRKSYIISQALNNSETWVLVTDETGKITYVNDFVLKLTGYSREELIGENPRVFKSGYFDRNFYKRLWDTILSGKQFDFIFINRKKNGETFHLEQTIYPVLLAGNVRRFISVGKDITKESQILSEINKLKFYDPVTGLYNLNGFSFKATENLKDENLACLILFDILNFTLINNTYGFKFGDLVLKEVSERLKSRFRDGDLFARISSDQFGVMLSSLRKKEDIIVIAEKFMDIFNEEFQIEDISLPISVNAGVAVYPDDDTEFDELYKKASLALKEAKASGQPELRFYNREIEDRASVFAFAESLITKAVKENLFVFYYQPYFKTDDLSLVGFEALVRIKDMDGKVYNPSFFISILENSRFLRNFELWGLNEAKEKSKKWGKCVSLNISGRSFKDDKFLNILQEVEEEYSITYEITERLLIDEFEKIRSLVSQIKSKKNIRIAIDDFGTGYSSLNYLKDIDADIIKIDMSFIRSMVDTPKDLAVVKSIVDLAKNLGMESLAEGVETPQQYKILKSIGCTYVQGFLFGKPMPEEEVERIL